MSSRKKLKRQIQFIKNFLQLPEEMQISLIVAPLDGDMGLFTRLADNHYVIILDEGMTSEQQLHTIAHELVHIKQRLDGRLIFKQKKQIWCGTKYKIKTEDDYWLAPWEMEARAMEAYLASKWYNRKHTQKN